jgi:hypothetical protein
MRIAIARRSPYPCGGRKCSAHGTSALIDAEVGEGEVAAERDANGFVDGEVCRRVGLPLIASKK